MRVDADNDQIGAGADARVHTLHDGLSYR